MGHASLWQQDPEVNLGFGLLQADALVKALFVEVETVLVTLVYKHLQLFTWPGPVPCSNAESLADRGRLG